MPQTGHLIALEGLDGAGTTTQAEALTRRCLADGVRALWTAFPSEHATGQLIRKYLRRGIPKVPAPLFNKHLPLLFAADHLESLAFTILPALEEGKVVFCDRYLYSSVAYNTKKLDNRDWIFNLNRYARNPDLSILLRVTPEEASRRVVDRPGPHKRFDGILNVQERIARNYDTISQLLPDYLFAVVDGSLPPKMVTDHIYSLIEGLLVI